MNLNTTWYTKQINMHIITQVAVDHPVSMPVVEGWTGNQNWESSLGGTIQSSRMGGGETCLTHEVTFNCVLVFDRLKQPGRIVLMVHFTTTIPKITTKLQLACFTSIQGFQCKLLPFEWSFALFKHWKHTWLHTIFIFRVRKYLFPSANIIPFEIMWNYTQI